MSCLSVCLLITCRGSASEDVAGGSASEMAELQPLATDVQISVTTSLAVLAVYVATLHPSVPGGDSGIVH